MEIFQTWPIPIGRCDLKEKKEEEEKSQISYKYAWQTAMMEVSVHSTGPTKEVVHSA